MGCVQYESKCAMGAWGLILWNFFKGNLTFAKGIIFPKGKYCGYRNTSQKSQEGVSSTKATTYAQ